MMPRPKMKRSHSPDNIGISNYKRQRLIQDLENLSISTDTLSRRTQMKEKASLTSSKHAGLHIVPNAIKDRIWGLIEKDSSNDSSSAKLYDKIWEEIKASNLQVIKWYNTAELVYRTWFAWFQKQRGLFNMERDVNMDVDEDDYGYEPMDVDMG